MLKALSKSWLSFWEPLVSPEAYLQRTFLAEIPTLKTLLVDNAHRVQYYADFRRRDVRRLFAGEDAAKTRGQGMDFAELRQYLPGDDIRKLDWQVFARTLVPHIREYHQERQQTIWLAVDLSPTLLSGPGCRFIESSGLGQNQEKKTRRCVPDKLFRLFQVVEWLSYQAESAKARLGLFVVDAEKRTIIQPKPGPAQTRHILSRLEALICQMPDSGESRDLFSALLPVVQKQDWVFLFSDGLHHDHHWMRPLGALSQRGPVHWFFLHGPAEWHLPPRRTLRSRGIQIQDPKSGKSRLMPHQVDDFTLDYQQWVDAQMAAFQPIGEVIPIHYQQSWDDIRKDLALGKQYAGGAGVSR